MELFMQLNEWSLFIIVVTGYSLLFYNYKSIYLDHQSLLGFYLEVFKRIADLGRPVSTLRLGTTRLICAQAPKNWLERPVARIFFFFLFLLLVAFFVCLMDGPGHISPRHRVQIGQNEAGYFFKGSARPGRRVIGFQADQANPYAHLYF